MGYALSNRRRGSLNPLFNPRSIAHARRWNRIGGDGIRTPWVIVILLVIVAASITGYWVLRPADEGVGLKVGVVLWGHRDEGLWDPAAANAVLNLQEKYDLEITWSEEIEITQIETIIRTLAQTNDVVYLTTDEFEEACKTVAPDFPDVYWIMEYEAQEITSDHFPTNVVAFNAYRANELSFWAGAIAAQITETGKLGIVQAIPGPRDTRLMSAAFRAGAHYVNASIDVSRTVIGAYVDPIQTRDSVGAFAEAGCDVVFVGMDDVSGTLEAQERGIYSIQEYADITASYPDTLIGCTVWKWDLWIDKVFEAIVNGDFDAFRLQNYEMPLSLADRSLDIPTFGTMVSQEVRDFAEDLRLQIVDGTVTVPVIDVW